MPVQEFPCATFVSKDLCHSQGARSGILLTGDPSHLVLNRDRERQITAHLRAEVLDILLCTAVLKLCGCPLVSRPYLLPSLFGTTKRSEYRRILPLRRVLLPQGGVAIDKSRLRAFPLS